MNATSARRIARVRPVSPACRRPSTFLSPMMPRTSKVQRGGCGRLSDTPFPPPRRTPAVLHRSWLGTGRQRLTKPRSRSWHELPRPMSWAWHTTPGVQAEALPPQAFHKAATSVVGPGEAIELGPGVGHVDPEAELTVVIGSRAKGLTLGKALTAVLGFTIGNDVSARDLQKTDELWISAKSQDTFTPAGPWIVTGLDGANLAIGITHNGTELKAASSADLGWGVEEILVLRDLLHDSPPRRPRAHGLPRRVRSHRPRRHRQLPYRGNRGAHESGRGRGLRPR